MFQYNIILEYYIIPPYYIHDNIVVAIIKNISSFLVIVYRCMAGYGQPPVNT